MSDLSEYELKRLENIKRNEAFLASLGLDSIKPEAPKKSTGTTKEIQERKAKAAAER
jgi:hypothetical protein